MVSVYRGELTTQGIIQNISRIKLTFPCLPIEFYDILTDRLKVHGFSDARLTDAVLHVIDTCKYPTPTIADFITYDKRVPSFHCPDAKTVR
jgi:hypothetical protein